jgi:predicted ATPase
MPLRLIGASRDTEVQSLAPLSVVLADLAQAGLAARRSLPPLAPEEAAQLLDGLLEGEGQEDMQAVRERVLQRAGGVPFFLVTCALAARAREKEGTGGGDAVPWDAAEGIRQRMGGLSAAAQELLGLAAVAGRESSRRLLTQVAGRPARSVAAALQAAVQAHLLEEAGPSAYRFVHDVIREVVEADLGAAQRMLLHEEIALALEHSPGEQDAADTH